MIKEEIIGLAQKIKEGKATSEETKSFFEEFNKIVDDLEEFLKTLPKENK